MCSDNSSWLTPKWSNNWYQGDNLKHPYHSSPLNHSKPPPDDAISPPPTSVVILSYLARVERWELCNSMALLRSACLTRRGPARTVRYVENLLPVITMRFLVWELTHLNNKSICHDKHPPPPRTFSFFLGRTCLITEQINQISVILGNKSWEAVVAEWITQRTFIQRVLGSKPEDWHLLHISYTLTEFVKQEEQPLSEWVSYKIVPVLCKICFKYYYFTSKHHSHHQRSIYTPQKK